MKAYLRRGTARELLLRYKEALKGMPIFKKLSGTSFGFDLECWRRIVDKDMYHRTAITRKFGRFSCTQILHWSGRTSCLLCFVISIFAVF